jgi:hypothetical protein
MLPSANPGVVSWRRVTRTALTALTAATMVCVAGGAAAAAPSETPPASDLLRPFTTHRVEGLSLRVQPPGVTVWGEAVRADGDSVIVGLRSDPDGRTSVLHRATAHRDHAAVQHDHAAASASFLAAAAAAGPCSDGAHLTYGHRWGKTYRWRFKRSTRPSGLNKDKVTAAVKNAVINVTGAHNDCQQADQVGALHRYLGTTYRRPGIGPTSGCGRADGVNVVAFGNLAGGDLAMTCWWTLGGKVVEADVKLNKAEYGWVVTVPKRCSRKWSIEAVATHEFGHVFGLGHVSESTHPALTMSPSIRSCQRSEASLGLGDLLGLEKKY